MKWMPTPSQVLDRIVGRPDCLLVGQVPLEPVRHDRVEQALLVAELAVQGGRLYPGRGGHGSGGDAVRTGRDQQLGGGVEDAFTGVTGHVGNAIRYVLASVTTTLTKMC